MKNEEDQTDSNPFKRGQVNQVWKELLRKSKPISLERAHQKMKEAAALQKGGVK